MEKKQDTSGKSLHAERWQPIQVEAENSVWEPDGKSNLIDVYLGLLEITKNSKAIS